MCLAFEYVPAEHPWQVCSPEEEIWPLAQSLHLVCPAFEYRPLWQDVQLVGFFASGSPAENCPASQLLQLGMSPP